MPSDSSNLKFEIGHVLFIAIVGYSKLLISDQCKLLQTLKEQYIDAPDFDSCGLQRVQKFLKRQSPDA